MSTRILRSQIVSVILCACIPALSQNAYLAGLLPSLNLNKSLDPLYSLNVKAESRQGIVAGVISGESLAQYTYILTDLSLIASRRVGLGNQLAAGYLVRFRDGRVVHRIIQQYSLIKFYNSFRLGHRFAADQTFRSGRDIEIRLRYRATFELPLSGTAVDPREFYLKGNTEILQSIQGTLIDLEWRLMPYLGYVFSDDNKLEAGLDYRWGDLVAFGSSHQLWVSLSWYLKL